MNTTSETNTAISTEIPADEETLEAINSAATEQVDSMMDETVSTPIEAKEMASSKIVEEKKEIEDKASVKNVANKEKEVKKKKKKRKRGTAKFAELSYDFGEIKSGDVIEHTFKFNNAGDGVLNVKDAVGSCGCTRPSFPFLPIEPGDGGEIVVTYNSVGKEGKQEATITVQTDGEPRAVKLKIKGNVLPKE